MAPSAPVFADLHWRAKGANQNCCSIKGTKKLLRRGAAQAIRPSLACVAIGIEHALDVAVQRPHDPDPRKHRRPAQCRHEDEGLQCDLPFRCLVFGSGSRRQVDHGTKMANAMKKRAPIGDGINIGPRRQAAAVTVVGVGYAIAVGVIAPMSRLGGSSN